MKRRRYTLCIAHVIQINLHGQCISQYYFFTMARNSLMEFTFSKSPKLNPSPVTSFNFESFTILIFGSVTKCMLERIRSLSAVETNKDGRFATHLRTFRLRSMSGTFKISIRFVTQPFVYPRFPWWRVGYVLKNGRFCSIIVCARCSKSCRFDFVPAGVRIYRQTIWGIYPKERP